MISFYQSVKFNGVNNSTIKRSDIGSYTNIICSNKRQVDEFLFFDKKLAYERYGVLEGEYILDESCMFLIDSSGQAIMINCAWELGDIINITSFINSQEIRQKRMDLVNRWDEYDSIPSCAIMHHPYSNNYFHFTYEVIGASRHLKKFPFKTVVVNRSLMDKNYKIDLVSKVFSGKNLYVSDRPLKVKDPVICYSEYSDESVYYLRNIVEKRAYKGGRKIYIPRNGKSGRVACENSISGGIMHTKQFVDVLRKHSFEIVSFGDGDLHIDEQIELINGADIILSPHGAALANLGYASSGMTLIEVVTGAINYALYASLCHVVGIRHITYGGELYHDNGEVYVDPEVLDGVLSSL